MQLRCNCFETICREVQVLIIGYVSVDNTAEIASGLLKEDRGVTFIMKRANEGRINSYNDGFDCLYANYILILLAEYGLLPGPMVGRR